MTRAYTVQEFDYYMAEVERIDKRVKKYLLDIGYEKWTRAHSAVNRTMTMTSNVAESLNSATKSARELPVMKLFDEMRKLVEKWSYTNMKEAQGKLTALTKTYEDILAEKLSEGQHMTARPSSDYLHTVIFMGRTFIVDIKERTCTCRRFQLDELPCAHSLAVLSSKGLHSEDYCSLYYTIGYMKKTYVIPVNPMPDDTSWEVPSSVLNEVVLHPDGNKVPGRPPMKRKQKHWQKEEKLFKSSCGRCKKEGHNVRTCRNMPKKN